MKKILNSLYIVSPDRYLSLDGENVVIHHEREQIGRVPLHNIDGITIFGSAGASPALIGKCCEYNKPITFLSRSGKFLFRCEGEETGNVILRREQYRIADNEEKSLTIAKSMIAGKIYNCRYIISRMMRDHAMRIDVQNFSHKHKILTESAEQAFNASSSDSLRGIEGEAARIYFSIFDDMILQQKEDFYYKSRTKRPPLDNINALLSLTYTITANMCCAALENVGLDPYVGFLHTDRPGRRSLALDLMEEFRSVLCDRFVISLINKRMINPEHFEHKENGAVQLTDKGKQIFFSAWQDRKQEELKHPYLSEKMQWGMLPFVQATLLARYIRGDIDGYPVFLWRG